MTDTYHQQYATDFNSVLNCPPLICSAPYCADDDWLHTFRSKAIIPTPSLYQGNHRLGFYYQWLWKQLIEAHPDYLLIAEEIPLRWNKQTLGAIDFLVKNLNTDQLEHWEVAIKFYLAYQQSWPGPNAKDNLNKKIHRMLNHQLQLCEHSAYQAQLANQYGQPEVKRLIMQGRLFYPATDYAVGSGIETNPNALTGSWCYRYKAAELRLKTVSKTHWISPPRYHTLDKQLELEQLDMPVQAIAPDDSVWFVMPDHWPTI